MPRVRQVLAVLGMHRSGTSALAGSLQQAGLDLGVVSTHNTFNTKGNREHTAIRRLHDDVLSANGGSWDNPPEQTVWNDAQRATRDTIIAQFSYARTWGFKDPRLLFLTAGWLEAIPALSFVGVFRHPVPVARSLEARNGFSRSKSFDLWRRYNRRLLRVHDEFRFPILCFDWPAHMFMSALNALAERMHLRAPPTSEHFFEDELRHHSLGTPEPLDDDLQELYEQLEARAPQQF